MQTISVPSLVRIKPGALDRLGIYLSREKRRNVLVVASAGLPATIVERAKRSLLEHGVSEADYREVSDASFEQSLEVFGHLNPQCEAIVGLGGGRALDTAKYTAFLARLPYYAVPTSVSNDGFCSPQSSLTLEGRRRSLPASLPIGVIVDTEVCLAAPLSLWLSGVGDLVAKITAVFDWKLAFHQRQTPVNDLAALLSDATVYQFMAQPTRDAEGMQLLATALLLNGIAMEICGSSRPASGSEHLISHALDEMSSRPRLHGLQVGMATYLVSCLQNHQRQRIAEVLGQTGFWELIRTDPFPHEEWLAAISRAPAIKPDRYTILSSGDRTAEIAKVIETDPVLTGCFV